MIDKNIRFDYSLDKDALLRSERGVDFDVVISKLREQVELIITPHQILKNTLIKLFLRF
jgi:hypothetical protein